MATTPPRVISRRRQPTTRGLAPRATNPFVSLGGLRGMNQAARLAPSAPTPVQSTAGLIGGSGSTPAPSQANADPRDPQYFNDLAKLEQFHTQRQADVQASINEGQRALTKNNMLLAEQQPRDTLAAKQNANKAGLLNSGFLGKNLGEIETSYARRKADLQQNFTTNQASLLRQYAGNNADYYLGQNDALLGGIGRATDRDAQFGVGAASGIPVPAAASSLPYTTQPGVSKTGVKGEWHVYPGGRRVFVRR
jgi:hypothetical protein